MWALDALWLLIQGLAVTVGPFVAYALIKGFYLRWKKSQLPREVNTSRVEHVEGR